MIEIKRRNPVIVFLLTLITCGFYLIFWYYSMYKGLKSITQETPTGNSYAFDLLLTIISLGIWGIYVDYAISKQLHKIRTKNNLPGEDTSLLVLILDAVSIFSLHLLWILTSSIQQDEWNKIIEQIAIQKPMSDFYNKPQNDPHNPNPYT